MLARFDRAGSCLVRDDDVPPLTRKTREPAPFPTKPGAPALISTTLDPKSLARHNHIRLERARSTVLARSYSSWTMYHRCRESSLRCTTEQRASTHSSEPALTESSQHSRFEPPLNSGMAAIDWLRNRFRELTESLGRFIRNRACSLDSIVLPQRRSTGLNVLAQFYRAGSIIVNPRTEEAERHAIKDRLLSKISLMDQSILQGQNVLDVGGPAWEVGSA